MEVDNTPCRARMSAPATLDRFHSRSRFSPFPSNLTLAMYQKNAVCEDWSGFLTWLLQLGIIQADQTASAGSWPSHIAVRYTRRPPILQEVFWWCYGDTGGLRAAASFPPHIQRPRCRKLRAARARHCRGKRISSRHVKRLLWTTSSVTEPGLIRSLAGWSTQIARLSFVADRARVASCIDNMVACIARTVG